MVYIYILLLEKNKYYVGKTRNPEFRLESHFNSDGSEWTKSYKPIKILKLIEDCDDYDEDKYTRKCMDKFGIENVRGGSFSQKILPPEIIHLLEKMKKTVEDECYKCGEKGHFSKDCTKTNLPDTVEELITFSEEHIKKLKEKEVLSKSIFSLTDETKCKKYIEICDFKIKKFENFEMFSIYNGELHKRIQMEIKSLTRFKNTLSFKPSLDRNGGRLNVPFSDSEVDLIDQLRVKKQKEKNSEYLPILEAMLKTIKIITKP